jgi:hypothetical protein
VKYAFVVLRRQSKKRWRVGGGHRSERLSTHWQASSWISNRFRSGYKVKVLGFLDKRILSFLKLLPHLEVELIFEFSLSLA